MKEKNYLLKLGEKEFKARLGGLADQASGHCLVQLGETSVLATAQAGGEMPNLGFFPLTCDYEERFYAAGKILGSRFIRREGRPSINAVLSSRMIDRAVRPLFPQNLNREVQCIATCLSWDTENDPSTLGLFGVSLALGISDIPFTGPVVSVRVAVMNEEFILNPSYEQREQAELDIVFACIEKNNEILINMIEARANEAQEDKLEGAFKFATPFLQELIDFQKKIIQENSKDKFIVQERPTSEALEKAVGKLLTNGLEDAMFQEDRKRSKDSVMVLEKEILEMVEKDFGQEYLETAKQIFQSSKEKLLSDNIIKQGKRTDSRKLDEVREISCGVNILPRTHGSALFNRGETRILSILTLGAPGDQQILEDMDFSGKKRFLHHYNFPPYSVGEVKRLGSPGRREIGHGMLAERALLPLVPGFDEFPYTIRLVSEALSSNGSTSMASVCAASLALMDAGVPIKRPAAGISIGIVQQGDKYKLLTDIQGPEDSCGDMDFKVAGTEKGITVLQMDVKMDGLTADIFKEALEKAKTARLGILSKMADVLAEPRKELSPFAPRIYTLQINPDKIGAVIGTGGKVINEIIDTCGVQIDIEDDGRVFISGQDEAMAQKALEWVQGIAKTYEVGELYEGKVVKVAEFGAFVELSPNQDGLVHVSELAPFRVERVSDVVKVGDKIPVKVISIDDQGKIGLSAKQAGFSPPIPKQSSSFVRNDHGDRKEGSFFKKRKRF